MSTAIISVRSLLERGRHQSDQYHYAKFRLVTSSPEVLAASGRNADYLLRLADLPPETVLRDASTFVWLNVHRVFRRIANDDFGSDFRREIDALLLTMFDCFLRLSETQAVYLANRTGSSLVLPCNGIEFEVDTSGRSTLTKNDAMTVVASHLTTDDRFQAKTASDSPVREALWPGTYVLHAKNEELFESFYIDEITGEAAKCGGYRERVMAALDEISAVDGSLAESIKREVRWFVPIGTTKDEHYFSFTSAMLKDVLFISLHQGADDLVEAIIHEYHHGALNYFMDTIQVFNASDNAVYYSPWKTEPRPLSGLFHGLFVFTACLDYYMKAETADTASRSKYRLARAGDIYYKLSIASRQVPRRSLTAEGSVIADACDAVRAAALGHWPAFSGDVPAYIGEHAREWQQRNPALVFQH